jgi:hypothetical protein
LLVKNLPNVKEYGVTRMLLPFWKELL